MMVGLAAVIGLLNGFLVAYVEVPPLFVTLATGMLAIGGVDILFLDQNVYNVPAGSLIDALNGATVLGIPRPVIVAALVFIVAWLFVSYTSAGKLIPRHG